MIYAIAYLIGGLVTFRIVFPHILESMTWGSGPADVEEVIYATIFSVLIGVFWGAIVPLALAAGLLWAILVPERYKPDGTRNSDWIENAGSWFKK